MMAPDTNSAAAQRADLRERLAALEHEQWVEWSRQIAATETLSPARLASWQQDWVPYAQLPEGAKERDRAYADRILAVLEGCPPAPAACEPDGRREPAG